ncbi:MAG TPA: M23 family metallopeptidase [Anaeromyxobacter sp.]|nr:M23 family metallopeptidase [Anaeromyxobacter sp.]
MRLSPASDPASGQAADGARLRQAAQAMEAVLLRQLLRSSGVYGGGEGPGASVRSDLFVNALSEAVEQAGGLGLSDTLTRSLGGDPPPPGPRSISPARPAQDAPAGAGGVPPLAGRLTSAFGVRPDPFTGELREHDGVDLSAPVGTPIRATRDGIVRAAGPRAGYGLAVEVDHGSGLTTLYGHASELLVSPGQLVRAGQPIARVGSTGRSTGPHLHFEVRMGGRPVDPVRALKIYSARVETDLGSGP